MSIAEPEIAEASASSEAEALVQYLRGRDVACPLCGYNLRDLARGRCPECGRELRLGVGLAEPRVGAWVTCLVAVTAAAGLGVMAVATVVQYGWRMLVESTGGSLTQTAVFAYFLGSLPLVPALIVFRRRYRRLSQATQWALAGVAAAATVLGFAAVVTQV